MLFRHVVCLYLHYTTVASKVKFFFQLPHFPESDTISPESFLTIHKQECLIMEDKNPIQVADRLFLVLETLADTGSVNLYGLR